MSSIFYSRLPKLLGKASHHQAHRLVAAGSLRYGSTTANKGDPYNRKCKPIKKLLIANRGEIAVRIHRTAKELDMITMALYSKEDNRSLHRIVADQSVQIGKNDTPVGAYLNQDEILETALKHNVDAIHPGYGFLSENADFAEAVEGAGIMWVGPAHQVVRKMGDKVRARKVSIEAGVPVIPGTDDPVGSAAEAIELCRKIGYPVMLKAAHGGGGRGMRRVFHENECAEMFDRASSEALSAFGNGEMFIEKLVTDGRHIEVQVVGDHTGSVLHLRERDCSVQRRNQKVVEIAPAPFLKAETREKILLDAVKLARHVGYQNAGTIEFLLDGQENHYFMEVNARLQVEHTVTEEISGQDLVRLQLKVREGMPLKDLGLTQESVDGMIKAIDSVAIQCRITTEDSMRDFRPTTGRIDLYQPATGLGVRLDSAIGASGFVVTPHYDSLLSKIITKAPTFATCVKRAERALLETRIRGVTTNIPFILNVLSHPTFRSGAATTRFIDDHPELVAYDPVDLTSQNLCTYLAEIAVNGPTTTLVNQREFPDRTPARPPQLPESATAHLKPNLRGGGSWVGPPLNLETGELSRVSDGAPRGYKQLLDAVGPSEFSKLIRSESRLCLSDTSMRDAHQSLLATRLRTYDMIAVAPSYAYNLAALFSLENWGGATFDVAYRFLRESPWKRLELLREAIPNIPFQMLLRGANAVGYSAYPDNVVEKFCVEAVRYGMDIFRIFDSLNYLENLKMGIQAVGSAGGVVEAAISYTGNVADPNRGPYNLDYYRQLATSLVNEDIHILAIKDMAGLLTPTASRILVSAIRADHPHMPIHMHTHDTGGNGVASMIAAAEAGADIVDVAMDSLSGLTSQPSIGAVVAGMAFTDKDTGFDIEKLSEFSDYWEKVRRHYSPFDCTSTLKATSSDVYQHEIPGGQFTNLHMQAWSMGLAEKWPEIKHAYKEANQLLGDIIKVTPSSKIVGDLAQFMVQNEITAENALEKADSLSFPQSVVEYFQGYIGQPPFGFPEPLRSKVLKGQKVIEGRPGSSLSPVDWDNVKNSLEERHNRKFRTADLVSSVVYPQVFDEYQDFVKEYGDVSILPSAEYFTGAVVGAEL
eukprot:GHVN01053549.1.p1 GENE.GHVN01053549.1~~GHVN01053549.1.p1  ORF type:complete len:1100 (+),score=200.78 GHVN01053549.1:305-3604(+)